MSKSSVNAPIRKKPRTILATDKNHLGSFLNKAMIPAEIITKQGKEISILGVNKATIIAPKDMN